MNGEKERDIVIAFCESDIPPIWRMGTMVGNTLYQNEYLFPKDCAATQEIDEAGCVIYINGFPPREERLVGEVVWRKKGDILIGLLKKPCKITRRSLHELEMRRGAVYFYPDDGRFRYYPHVTSASYSRLLRSRRAWIDGILLNSFTAQIRWRTALWFGSAYFDLREKHLFFLAACARLVCSLLQDGHKPNFSGFRLVEWIR